MVALLFAGGLQGQSQFEQFAQMPDYATVYKQLIQSGLTPELKDAVFKIAKTEQGYEVYPFAPQERKRLGGNQLFWSLQEGKYLTISGIGKEEVKGTSAMNLSPFSIDARDYDLHPFYGYEGWAGDVVRVFDKAPQLNDQMLNGLGRAYSRIASLYLSGRSGETPSPSALKFNETYDPAVFDAEDLLAYDQNIANAIEAFKRLDQQNPAFRNIVGFPRIKYANEHMTAYLDLMMIGQPGAAKKWLKPDVYPGLFLQMARNYLRSCPQNTVLFTSGDNDTYPLLYVQQTEGFRTDVTVVNQSLLNTGRYIHYLENGLPAGNRLKFSLPFASTYSDMLPSYLMVGEGTLSDAEDFLLTVEQSMASEKPETSTNSVLFGMDPSLSDTHGASPQGSHPMPVFEFNARQYRAYWLRKDIFLIDFLHTNAWKRPVCFSSGTDPESFRGIEDHCWYKGFVYELLPYVRSNGAPNSRLDTPFDSKAMLDLLIEEWQFNMLKTWSLKVSVGDVLDIFPLKQTFMLLMDEQGRTSNFDGAPVVIDLYMQHLWPTHPGVTNEKVFVAEYALKAGLDRRAFVMLDKMYIDCNRMLTQLTSGVEFPINSTDPLEYTLNWLPEQYRNLGDPAKAKQVETLHEKYKRNHE